MNKFICVGRICTDIKTSKTKNGKYMAQFNIAIPRTKEVTDFILCKAFEKCAEIIEQHFNKGDRIAASGKIQIDKNNDLYYTNFIINEVSFIETLKDKQQEQSKYQEEKDKFINDSIDFLANIDEELPF